MAHVTITDDLLTVALPGLHQLWALKRRIQVPLAHVRGATADPGMIGEPKGLRWPGLHVPGIVVGAFRRDGETHFWDVRTGRRAIVIELTGEPYARLIVDVDDPHSTVAAIKPRRSPRPHAPLADPARNASVRTLVVSPHGKCAGTRFLVVRRRRTGESP